MGFEKILNLGNRITHGYKDSSLMKHTIIKVENAAEVAQNALDMENKQKTNKKQKQRIKSYDSRTLGNSRDG